MEHFISFYHFYLDLGSHHLPDNNPCGQIDFFDFLMVACASAIKTLENCASKTLESCTVQAAHHTLIFELGLL